jgi:hypothetical protein
MSVPGETSPQRDRSLPVNGMRGPLDEGAASMKKFAIMAAVAAASMMALPAVAHAEWYAGAAYTQYDTDNAEVGGVTGRLG